MDKEISKDDYINLFSSPLGRLVFMDILDNLGLFSVEIGTEEQRIRRDVAAELVYMVSRGKNEPVKAAIQALIDAAANSK